MYLRPLLRVMHLGLASCQDGLDPGSRAELGVGSLVMAHTPAAALASLSGEPDLVVVGWAFFERWGPEVLARLRARPELASTPVAVLLPAAGTAEASLALGIGGLAVVRAGTDSGSIGRLLRQLWRAHHAVGAASAPSD